MNVPGNLFYKKEHEWVKIEGNSATMGITDYAQSSLGDITFVELPKIGQAAKQFGRISTVESVKAASDVYAPLSGKAAKINDSLSNTPELINKSPYDKGWFLVIEIKDIKEKDNLLTSQAYSKYIEGLQR